MATPDSTIQQTKVGILQGGDTIFVKSDGYFNVNGADLTGAQLRSLLYVGLQTSVIANSAGVLSVVNLTSAGVQIFSIADAASNASAWFTSGPVAGQKMFLMMRGAGNAGSVFISTSGVSLVGTISTDLSSISLQNSADISSVGKLWLECFSDGEWSVVNRSLSGVVEQGSS